MNNKYILYFIIYMTDILPLFSDDFLNVKEQELNKNKVTLCQEENKNFHNSEFIWCEKCNKIICTNCSYDHLMKNQIIHTPIESVFFNKEKLDIEYQRNEEKLKKFEEMSTKYFKTVNTLYILCKSFYSFTEGMCKFFNNIKINLDKKLSFLYSGKLSEFEQKQEIIVSKIIKLKQNYDNIKNNYFQSNNFNAKLIQKYFDELKQNHKQFIQIYKYSENDLQKYDNLLNVLNNNNVNLNDLAKFVEKIMNDLNPILEQFLKYDIYNKLNK